MWFNFRRLIVKPTLMKSMRRNCRRRGHAFVHFERLEPRQLLAVDTPTVMWQSATPGNWTDPSKWLANSPPTVSTRDILLGNSFNASIILNQSEGYSNASIDVISNTTTLDLHGNILTAKELDLTPILINQATRLNLTSTAGGLAPGMIVGTVNVVGAGVSSPDTLSLTNGVKLTATGQITVSDGGTLEAASSQLVGGSVVVDNSGWLNLLNESQLYSSTGTIGSAGAWTSVGEGHVVVDGNRSNWSLGSLMVNNGSLEVDGSGAVFASAAYIGANPGQSAEVSVDDGGRLNLFVIPASNNAVATTLFVGPSGTGRLDVFYGGVLDSNGAAIGGPTKGATSPGNGQVTVYAEGLWDARGPLSVSGFPTNAPPISVLGQLTVEARAIASNLDGKS